MDDPEAFTDVPDIREPGEEPPDFDELEPPEATLKDLPIRERLLDVVLQLRSPTKVAEIADRADCDAGTAREYLDWFSTLGIVREFEGRPTQYQRNDAYLKWRRVERIRQEHSDDEIVDELSSVLDTLAEYRERFGTDDPDAVSLIEESRERPTEEVWSDLVTWKTLERRAELLDAARRNEHDPSGRTGLADA